MHETQRSFSGDVSERKSRSGIKAGRIADLAGEQLIALHEKSSPIRQATLISIKLPNADYLRQVYVATSAEGL